ncbi:MAG: protein kinase [Thermoanaerobaculia bacterium]
MSLPERIGRYRILAKLGEGGMGVVYAAADERLGRSIALKVIGGTMRDEDARKRFWREARLAASVSHPNVCAIHEVGEEDGELFIVMELLEGEALSSRLARGGVAAAEGVRIALGILAALDALHARGLVHRDVKPANVFLTPHGVKLVDFGIARSVTAGDAGGDEQTQLTQAGDVVGTPHYMSPEQLRGEPVDARSDLFATGAVIFEMIAGRRAFEGRTKIDVLHATLHDMPPLLLGSALTEAVGRVVLRALAKNPDERPRTASAMAHDLDQAMRDPGAQTATAPMPSVATRLIVLPFRILRPDPDTDFLAFSLADAIASSLAGLGSLVVRSSLAAARFADSPDLKRIAVEADVDLVLAGTLLRAGAQIRVQCQLTEAAAGSLLWSHTAQVPLTDVFQLEEELGRRIVESIARPLTAREHREVRRDAPASALAYEHFLRANQIGLSVNAVEGPRTQLPIARDLYIRSLEEDPGFAPAWARLGRCYRLLAKTGEEPARNFELAEAAFRRALELNPDLPSTHHLYAALECDRGRAIDALERLVTRAAVFPNDPELFVGLVQACRYSGLLEESLAAHERATRLDPHAMTSVALTLWLRGDNERALQAAAGNVLVRTTILSSMGREDEASAAVPAPSPEMQPLTALFWTSFRAALDGSADHGRAAAEQRLALVQDPEARFHGARHLARMGEGQRAFDELSLLVDSSFLCPDFLERDPWLESVRRLDDFPGLLARMRSRVTEAGERFAAAGGRGVLGPPGTT